MKAAPIFFVFCCFASALRASEPSTGTTETTVPSQFPGSIELTPQLSIISPGKMILTNGNFAVPYSESFAGLPAVHLGVAKALGSVANIQISAVARLGYTSKSAPISVRTIGGKTQTADVHLHWLPLSVSARLLYGIPGETFVKPMLNIGGGVQYLNQSSTLVGLSDSFWVPYIFVTPGLTFLQGTRESDWFGGFAFGVSLQRSIAANQFVNGWSFDMSFDIFL